MNTTPEEPTHILAVTSQAVYKEAKPKKETSREQYYAPIENAFLAHNFDLKTFEGRGARALELEILKHPFLERAYELNKDITIRGEKGKPLTTEQKMLRIFNTQRLIDLHVNVRKIPYEVMLDYTLSFDAGATLSYFAAGVQEACHASDTDDVHKPRFIGPPKMIVDLENVLTKHNTHITVDGERLLLVQGFEIMDYKGAEIDDDKFYCLNVFSGAILGMWVAYNTIYDTQVRTQKYIMPASLRLNLDGRQGKVVSLHLPGFLRRKVMNAAYKQEYLGKTYLVVDEETVMHNLSLPGSSKALDEETSEDTVKASAPLFEEEE